MKKAKIKFSWKCESCKKVHSLSWPISEAYIFTEVQDRDDKRELNLSDYIWMFCDKCSRQTQCFITKTGKFKNTGITKEGEK